jgi:glycosyltransferase involved in cell wall biosynthesis
MRGPGRHGVLGAMLTTVAIPVLNGGPILERVLRAVAAQRVDGEVEVLICDSGSSDGSAALARRLGAEVIEIPSCQFGHGRTRNLLMERSGGSHVAFLTQDALPAGADWLRGLLAGFSLACDVALVFGPYRPRPEASPMVARELIQFFERMSPDGRERVDRLTAAQRAAPARELLGPRGFFSDANGCIARSAWSRVPFRDVPYAEDQHLAVDMLRAGFAKVFVPEAAVIHSHDYSTLGWLRRSFDEARSLHDVYGFDAPLEAKLTALKIWGTIGGDRRWALEGRPGGLGARGELALLTRSTVHHVARTTGAVLGARVGLCVGYRSRAGRSE